MHGLNSTDLYIQALAALPDDAAKLLGVKVAAAKELEGEIVRIARRNGGLVPEPAWFRLDWTAAEACMT